MAIRERVGSPIEKLHLTGSTLIDNSAGAGVFFDAQLASGASLLVLEHPTGACNGQPWRTGNSAAFVAALANGLTNAWGAQGNYAGVSTNLPVPQTGVSDQRVKRNVLTIDREKAAELSRRVRPAGPPARAAVRRSAMNRNCQGSEVELCGA